MLRATSVIRKADLGKRIAIDTITLDREGRYRRRVALSTDRGHAFLLDLPEATYLAPGDALELSNGALVKVVAAAEDLLEIHATDALALAKIAWHLGNRHTPAEVTRDAIYIQPDHVLAEMVERHGAHVHAVRRPFEPEGGAYGGHGALQAGHHHGGGHHHHHDDHGHSRSHSHAHDHQHQHAHSHDHSHAHGDDGHHHDADTSSAQSPARPRVWRPE